MSLRSIVASGKAANAASSFRCFLDAIFVHLSFARCRFTRGDDSDRFFAAFFASGVNHEQHDNAGRQTDRNPPFFVLLRFVDLAYGARIIENKLGGLKADSVLCAVPAAFLLVPNE